MKNGCYVIHIEGYGDYMPLAAGMLSYGWLAAAAAITPY